MAAQVFPEPPRQESAVDPPRRPACPVQDGIRPFTGQCAHFGSKQNRT